LGQFTGRAKFCPFFFCSRTTPVVARAAECAHHSDDTQEAWAWAGRHLVRETAPIGMVIRHAYDDLDRRLESRDPADRGQAGDETLFSEHRAGHGRKT
jgi:hypothetical protein